MEEIKDVTEDGPISIKMISKLIMVTSKMKKVNNKNIKVKNNKNIGKLYEKSKKKTEDTICNDLCEDNKKINKNIDKIDNFQKQSSKKILNKPITC